MITWTLNEQTADFILKCLMQRPYAEVEALIKELVRQANSSKQQQIPGMEAK